MFFYNSNHGRVDHNHTCIPSLYAYQTRGPPVGCGVCLCGGRPVEKIFMPVPDFGYFTWGKGPMLWDLKYYIKKAFQPCCCCFFFAFTFLSLLTRHFHSRDLGCSIIILVRQGYATRGHGESPHLDLKWTHRGHLLLSYSVAFCCQNFAPRLRGSSL
jgi:hypothetical protein